MLERLVFRPLLGGEQTGGRNRDLSLRSSAALDYARGRLLWKEPDRVLGRLKATFPLPQGLERLCHARAALGNYTKPPGRRSVTLCLLNGEWPAGAATGQGWKPPSTEEKSGLESTGNFIIVMKLTVPS